MIQHIAIVRLSALGDIINTAFVLQFIKQKYPDIKIDWVCEEVFAPLLQNQQELHNIITINLKQLKKEKSLSLLQENISKLKSTPSYDKIIDTQGLLKSAIVAKILGKNTHGFDKYSIRESIASLFYQTTTSIPYEENVILRNAKIISDALNFSITKEMIEQKKAIFPFTKKETPPYIVFVIGASWKSKQYPKENIIKVIQNLPEIQSYIIWASEEEKKDAGYITSKTDAKLVPKMNLVELVEFISNATLVIGNDTGPTHLAWAQNIPSITLFGPTNERMIFQTKINKFLKSPSKVNILKINKNDYSIKDIDPNQVVSLAKELLNGI